MMWTHCKLRPLMLYINTVLMQLARTHFQGLSSHSHEQASFCLIQILTYSSHLRLTGQSVRHRVTCSSEGLMWNILYSIRKLYTERSSPREHESSEACQPKTCRQPWQIWKGGNQFIIESYFNSLIKIENHATDLVIYEMISC